MKVDDVPEEWVHQLASSLDHPSVFMGGPSERNKKRARYVLAAVIPAIQAEALERAAVVLNDAATRIRGGKKRINMVDEHTASVLDEKAAAIRALKEGT